MRNFWRLSLVAVLVAEVSCSELQQSAELAAVKVTGCVQIFRDHQDAAPADNYYAQQLSIMLQNLLGHFPELQQINVPVDRYQPKQIEACKNNFYIGSVYNADLSKDFIDDFVATKQNAVWMGSNLWKLGQENLTKLWDAKFKSIGTLDTRNLDARATQLFSQRKL